MQAKGPNALNMNAYVNGEESDGEYMEEGTSSRPNIDVKAIEDQFNTFMEDAKKYDRILSEVAKNIEQIDGEGQFITDFYPKFISESTYEEQQQKRIIANTDPDLAKIMFNLQRTNKVLKADMRSWVLEFAKTAKLTQVLIEENKILRQSIAGKNKQIVKLIEGIGLAQNEEITELQQGLELLREENGVLREHLIKLKEEAAERKREQERVTQTLERARKEFSELQREREAAQDEEEHLSKTYELIEQWRGQTDRNRRKLQRERDSLIQRRTQLEEQRQRIERELHICAKDKQELQSGLKRDYQEQQTEKYRLMEEIHELGDRISRQKEEGRYYDEQIGRNVAKRQQYEKITRDYAKKAAQNEDQLKALRQELAAAQEQEIAVECEAQLERYDIEMLTKELNEVEERERQLDENWKNLVKAKQAEYEKGMENWRSKKINKERELSNSVKQAQNQLNILKRQLETWEEKVYDKKTEFTELQEHLKEVRQNQAKLAQLKAKLHAQESA